MAITNIAVSKCFSYINDANKRRFEIKISSELAGDLRSKGVSVYYGDTPLLLAKTGVVTVLQPLFELEIDTNVDEFLAVVSKEGFKYYPIRVEVNLPGGALGESFYSNIQFMDIEPNIYDYIITDNVGIDLASVEVLIKYYSPGVSLRLVNEKHDKSYPFEGFEYDEALEVWRSKVVVDKSIGKCHEKLIFSIIGEYIGEDLPCTSEWSTRIVLDETLNGVCMNTNWQNNLNIFWDNIGSDSIRDLQMTKKSGHLLATYVAPVASTNNSSLMTRMQTAQGALLPPVPICAIQARINKDANTTAIDGTDEFVAIWAGNASGRFKIYVRKFTATPGGIQSSQFQEIDISGANGDYTCPRIIYNPVSKLLLATWVSTTEQKIVGTFLDPNTLEKMSYDFDISTNIHIGYKNVNLELDTAVTENIVLMNHGEKIVIGYLEKPGELKFLSIGKPSAGTPPISAMTQYSQVSMGKFHAVLDELKNSIMLVYVFGQDIYGTNIRVFAYAGAETYAATKLNSISSGASSFPYINKARTQQESYEFHVAWTSTTMGAFFNRFETNFFAIDAETRVNEQGTGNMYPKLVASDNQIAMLFEATKFNAVPLQGQGILSYVKPRN
ncbi:hypothetical protein [Serratia inhibens]|uniref:hypothetical protein n=1 Tax=Serratia inhibens TaxID=2338073 RepID=UPI00025E2BB0|nr:hypothetical protein [Serratia inhibens]ANS43564.1 hypothetical protein Q5A_015575 [Serratia inhibens PRI-2C]